MKYGLYIGWGIVIYAIMYLTWAGMNMYGFSQGILPRIAELIVLVIVTTVAGRSLKFESWQDILPYSISWVIVVLVLDALFIVPLSGIDAYGDWHLWAGYALVVFLPLLAPLTREGMEIDKS